MILHKRRALLAALQSAEVSQQFIAEGTLPARGSADEFRSARRDEKAKWAPIVRAINIKLD